MKSINYKIGFDILALLLFFIIMLPNFIWSAIPAPNDILRIDSVTKTIDSITSIIQILMIISLCFIKNNKAKKFNVNLFILGTGICCFLYYLTWIIYYMGITNNIIILGLTLFPCFAFLIYAFERKNIIALILTLLFTIGHIIYALVNFIL